MWRQPSGGFFARLVIAVGADDNAEIGFSNDA